MYLRSDDVGYAIDTASYSYETETDTHNRAEQSRTENRTESSALLFPSYSDIVSYLKCEISFLCLN